MSQRTPEARDPNPGFQTNYAESMPGGNAEFVPITPQDPELVTPQPKWVDNQEPLREIHPKQPSTFRSRRSRILVITAIVLVALGIGIGVGVGISLATRKGDPRTAAPSSSTSSTTSPTASAIPTSFNVLAAVHGNAKVTPEAKQLVDEKGNIVFDSHPFPFRDTMFGYTKCFSLLHQFGSNDDEDMRIFHACEGTGFYKLEPGAIEKSRNTQSIPEHDLEQDGFRIFSILWGANELRERSVHEKVFKAGLNRDSVEFTNEFFGRTSDPGPNRGIPTGVIFYRSAADRPIRIILALENGTMPFDFS